MEKYKCQLIIGKPIETAPKDVVIQAKMEGGIPVTVLICSKYGAVYDPDGETWTVCVDYWREIEL